MQIVYTNHARKRMNERNISEEEVELCLEHHHTSYKDKKGNPIYKADIGSRQIKVVVDKSFPGKMIITVADKALRRQQ